MRIGSSICMVVLLTVGCLVGLGFLLSHAGHQQDDIVALQQQLGQLQRELETTRQARDRALADLAELRDQMAATLAELEAAQIAWQNTRAALAASEANLRDISTRLEAANASLRKAEAAVAELTVISNQRAVDLAQATTTVEQCKADLVAANLKVTAHTSSASQPDESGTMALSVNPLLFGTLVLGTITAFGLGGYRLHQGNQRRLRQLERPAAGTVLVRMDRAQLQHFIEQQRRRS